MARTAKAKSMIVTLQQPSLIVKHADGTVERATFPIPSVGWGSGNAVLSPKQRYIAVVWDSGQSDAGYELFALSPLRRIRGLPRVYGSGAIVAFSPDDRYLAMLSVNEPMLDSTVSDDEEEIEWAELRVRELPAGKVRVCSLSVTMPPIEEEGDNFFYPTVLRFKSAKTIELAGPSGTLISRQLPLPSSLELDPP
jgi:hypothetical protein